MASQYSHDGVAAATVVSRSSFGVLLRACRHRANLSQEELAARAGLSERAVRDLEAGRVRSPRRDTARLLADALQLTGPQRDSWMAAARRAGPAVPGAGGAPRPLADVPALLPSPGCGLDGEDTPQRCGWFTAEFTAEMGGLCRRSDRRTCPVAADSTGGEMAARAPASQAGPGVATGDDGGLTRAERRELAQLRCENRRLREGVEMLQRATAIVAAVTRWTSCPAIAAGRAGRAVPPGPSRDERLQS